MKAHPRSLRQVPFSPRVALLTGASGYVRALMAARMLADGVTKLIIPLRPGCSRKMLVERLDIELRALGMGWSEVSERVKTVGWKGADEIGSTDWPAALDDVGIEEIIHCAGCLDYFDLEALTAVNIKLTD